MILSLITLFLSIAPADFNDKDACAREVQQINTEMQKLSVERDQHAKKAQEYQSQGDRWQYYSNNVQDAYDAWAKADQERSQMIEIQSQIDAYQQRRDLIYQFYPDLRQA